MTDELKTCGVDLISQERQRQKDEGWTAEYDAKLIHDELAITAAFYAAQGTRAGPLFGRVDPDKAIRRTRIEQLQIAGALIAAELDRLMGV